MYEDCDNSVSDEEASVGKALRLEQHLMEVLEVPCPQQEMVDSAAESCFVYLKSLAGAACSSCEQTPIDGVSLRVLATHLGFQLGKEDFLLLLFGTSETTDDGLIVGLMDFSHPLAITFDSLKRLFHRTHRRSLETALDRIREEVDEAYEHYIVSQHSNYQQYHTLALQCAMLLGCNFLGAPRLVRAVDTKVAIPILMCTLSRRTPLIAPFCAFLNDRRVNCISRDTWSMLCHFCRQMIDVAQLANYSSLDSWPTLVDEFVTWLRERQQ